MIIINIIIIIIIIMFITINLRLGDRPRQGEPGQALQPVLGERYRWNKLNSSLSLSLYTYIYIYIYI